MSLGIVWFRQDLRLEDNPALQQACKECSQVLCVFIDDPMDQSMSRLGRASSVWLHHSLTALQESLQAKGNALHFAQGPAMTVLSELVAQTDASRLYWNRCYDPASIARDKQIKTEFKALSPATSNAMLLFEPWDNLKGDGSPYRVFTPFWRAAAAKMAENPDLLKVLKAPREIPPPAKKRIKQAKAFVPLDALGLIPDKAWPEAMMSGWQAGADGAKKRLSAFLKAPVSDYSDGRNLPACVGTSRLSPSLHFGEISPRAVLSRLLNGRSLSQLTDDEETYAKEIVWREFAYSLIYHYPKTINEPLDSRFANFEWAKNTDEHLKLWQRGLTGVPIVDAGMRELYATGWMHNRVRMIVASYLIKNLSIRWQAGEQWFRDTLVDADLASNAMGWQWTAGCGADAAPFFRVFNPVLQGEKFDKQGDYVKRWVPELKNIAPKFVHKPWDLPQSERNTLDYPAPLVDLKQTRQRALDSFAKIKGTK